MQLLWDFELVNTVHFDRIILPLILLHEYWTLREYVKYGSDIPALHGVMLLGCFSVNHIGILVPDNKRKPL